MYVYIKSESNLWTVGFYDPAGAWHPDSDHNEREPAAKRVNFLNGGRHAEEPKRLSKLRAQFPDPSRFAIVEDELTDGSLVYGVRFFCDYDPEISVQLDCEDQGAADAIFSALSTGVTSVEVKS